MQNSKVPVTNSKIMCKQLYISEGQLSTPLYNWISFHRNDWINNWNWCSNVHGHLYRRDRDTWYIYHSAGRTSRTYYATGIIFPTPSSSSISRASVHISRYRITVLNSSPITRNNRPSTSNKRFRLADREIPEFKLPWVMNNLEHDPLIGQLFKNVTDESYFELHNTMAASFK